MPDRVTVYWQDIYVVAGGWVSLTDAKGEPCDCETTGYLIEDSESRLVIAANYGTQDDKTEVNGTTVIPRGCITRVAKLREVE